MNKYDERYEIRIANKDDIKEIMNFINMYWKENHIMAKDKVLFEYEYVNKEKVNFILAIEKSTSLMEGIFGFLNCSNTEDSSKKDIWGSLWKVKENNMPFLGIELAKRAYELTKCRMHIGNGANKNTTIPLRRMFFKDKVGKMKQYYILNPKVNRFNIAIINEKKENLNILKDEKIKTKEFNNMKEITEIFNIESIESLPYKDNWYFEKRYFNHPYYRYKVYGIGKEEIDALIVVREIEKNKSKILRIVDYIGNRESFANTNSLFLKLFNEKDYEYIDFYLYGFEEKYLFNAGFNYRDENDINIIPNYFEPFVRENADIWIHYKYEGTTFFKADGDQDRPNELRC